MNRILDYQLATEEEVNIIKCDDGEVRIIIMTPNPQTEPIKLMRTAESTKKEIEKLSEEDSLIYETLRALRGQIAAEEHVRPYMVFNNKTLVDMVLKKPKTKEEMLNVSGVGEKLCSRYGDRFLEVLNDYY